MARLSEIIISWWLFITSQFSFDFITTNIMTKQRGKSTKELEQLMKNLTTKMQEVTSNVAVSEKNQKQYVRLQL